MKLLVLDGNSIINRAFYGIKMLTTKEGFPTNAIYGFLNILEKLKKEAEPDAVAVAFDLKAPTFRHEAYEGYKANRKGMPEDLALQMPKLKEILTALGYEIVQKEGFEADDILGTLAKTCCENGDECILATGDRDSLQLVDKNVSVRIAATKFGKPSVTVYDEKKIDEVYGITPKQLIEVKALQGDTSDNIPGVYGIGEKGALQLIKNYKNIDYIYENIENLEIKPAMKKKLENGKESAYLSRMLGTIKTDVPIDCDINRYIPREADDKTAVNLLQKMEMFATINKLGLDLNKINAVEEESTVPEQDIAVIEITASDDIKKLLEPLEDIFMLCEYNKDNSLKTVCLNIGFKVCVIREKEILADFIVQTSENNGKNIILYDLKSFILCADNFQGNVKFDVMLAAYLLNPDSKKYDIENLCCEYSIAAPKITPDTDDILIKNCAVLPLIYEKFLKELKIREQVDLLKKVEMPFSKVLADMEKQGFKTDTQGIKKYGAEISETIAELEKQIFELIGYEFNLRSSQQLSKALFEDLKLKKGKKTKSGYSTSAEVLERLKFDHPCVELILKYRTLTKLNSTYCEGLLKVIRDDGKIHTTFNQTETRTGRISSLEPNLQNIPVRTELGRKMRKFFTADEGHILVDADYSQIELRVLAHIADDKNMIEAFNNNEDIHTATAAQVFNIPEILVTPLMRTKAKAVNFGIVYGIGAFSLSRDIKVSVHQAQEYIDGYLRHFNGINRYMSEIVKEAKECGYVKTLFNRRRYLPELISSNYNIRAFGERVARNMPIQGTAADIIKIASINVYNRLKKDGLKSKLIMQVHDELIIDAHENEVKKVCGILAEEMENCVSLKVKLSVDVKTGKTWYDTKE